MAVFYSSVDQICLWRRNGKVMWQEKVGCFIGQMTLFKETNADSLIKRPIFPVINSQLFHVIQLFQSFYIFLHFLYIHCYLYITNITPHSPDDGSAEPKRYSVDFIPQ